jgi:hypothetical protein
VAKRPPLTGTEAFELARQVAGIKSPTTLRAWCDMFPEMVVAKYPRLTLIHADLFDEFLEMRPRQGAKWKPPPDPKSRPRPARAGEGGHGSLHD